MNKMSAITFKFMELEIYAVLDAQIIGKAVSGHPNQPVLVTVRLNTPDGGMLDLPLMFPGEEDAASVPAMHIGQNGYGSPIPVKIYITAPPTLEPEKSAPVETPDAD